MGKKIATGTPDDEEPRRLIFFKEDIEKIARVLNTMLRNTRAVGILLVDKDGHLLTREGEFGPATADAISTLVIESFAGKRRSAEGTYLALVGKRTMLVVIYDDHTTAAMVQLYADQVAGKLTELFDEIEHRK